MALSVAKCSYSNVLNRQRQSQVSGKSSKFSRFKYNSRNQFIQNLGDLHRSSVAAQAVPPDEQVQPIVDTQKQSIISTQTVILFIILLTASLVCISAFQVFVHQESFKWTLYQQVRRLVSDSQALRQSLALVVVGLLIRYFLEPVAEFISKKYYKKSFQKTFSYQLLQEAKNKAEILLFISATAVMVEHIVPPIISVSKRAVHSTVKAILSLIFVGMITHSGFKFKRLLIQEELWKSEMTAGSNVHVRRLQGYDKLITIGISTVSCVLGFQAVGLDLKTLFTLGSIGSVVIGLAAREILDNLMNGLLIMTQDAFRVGDEVQFHCNGQLIEGIVINIGWARTTFRTFAREVVAIPNSVFSRTPVINVTKKKSEWRINKTIQIRLADISKVPQIVADMQAVVLSDPRTIKSHHLHKRVFWTEVEKDVVTILVQFYVEARNKDNFLPIQQGFLMMFTEIIYGHGAQYAESQLNVNVLAGKSVNNHVADRVSEHVADHVSDATPGANTKRSSFEWYKSAKQPVQSMPANNGAGPVPIAATQQQAQQRFNLEAGLAHAPHIAHVSTTTHNPHATHTQLPHNPSSHFPPPHHHGHASPNQQHNPHHSHHSHQQHHAPPPPQMAPRPHDVPMYIDKEHPFWPVLRRPKN